MLCIASSYTWARKIPVLKPVETNVLFKYRSALALSSYDLDPLIIISQNMYEKGLVVIKGNFQKPNTTGDVKVTIKYRDNRNNWVSVWCRTFAGNYRYDEDLTANFELPSSALNVQSVKIELSSNKNITNWESIVWNKTISHYRHSDYVYGNCNLDENQIFINPVTEECPVSCFTVNAGAVSDFADWSKAPNSYIFTGKDKKTNADVDGLYIPVKRHIKCGNLILLWEAVLYLPVQ